MKILIKIFTILLFVDYFYAFEWKIVKEYNFSSLTQVSSFIQKIQTNF
jgi:hypothetical protein